MITAVIPVQFLDLKCSVAGRKERSMWCGVRNTPFSLTFCIFNAFFNNWYLGISEEIEVKITRIWTCPSFLADAPVRVQNPTLPPSQVIAFIRFSDNLTCYLYLEVKVASSNNSWFWPQGDSNEKDGCKQAISLTALWHYDSWEERREVFGTYCGTLH